MSLLTKINLEKCPEHIAIIMDGNGRWAKQQGEVRLFGHSIGVEAVREVLKACVDLGVRHLTLYAFSTENWNRPKEEVDGLMNLMVETISNEVAELDANNIRLRSIGDKSRLPDACRNELNSAMDATITNNSLDLILALNYSARWEMVDAAKRLAQKVEAGLMKSEDIDEKAFSSEMCINDIPDPELLIRTSGECRISNFMLWQIAYSELYFTDTLWPDFKREDLFKAVLDYQNRERRFGQVSEQLKK
ncbi:isoprenyl transferase [Brumimicrobium oceani]|uniref:Isoprenyl transferase n=1 Tax=Brumimicrobium oceani TaxID=2100725 RepID=A0A2U2X0Q8_9FLAO|nr:isoprenyl transferase [Brumimicrobium oceani]PWH81334.1 isoprenyl transferase [Brumimicrobium oceani]